MLPTEPPARDRLLPLSLCTSTLTGLVLRLWNLQDQILGGDELHAVRAAVKRPLSAILTTYAPADYSLPLTALYRLAMQAGATLSEWGFRLPALLCGCAALCVLPRLVRGKVDRAAVALFGWLLAVSPVLVLYSRIARSYAPMLLAGLGAVFAFEAWWHRRKPRYAVLYVAFAGLAVWLHLGAGTLVVAPFLFALGDLAVAKEERWRRFRGLVVTGAGLLLAFAAFLIPAHSSLMALIARKHQDLKVPLATVGDVLLLQAGSPWKTVAAVFWLAALAGLGVLFRDRPRLAAFTLTVAAGHVAGLLVLSPLGLGNPVILDRYLMAILPLVLLWLAYGLGWVWAGRNGRFLRVARRAAVALFLLLLVWAGPFCTTDFRTSSFLHHNDFVGFFAPLATLPADTVPAIYRRLAPGPVVEAPWPSAWGFCRSFSVYQQLHRHRVLVSAPFDIPRVAALRLRNEVPPEPEALLASPARTVIVHLRLAWEEDRVGALAERAAHPWLQKQRRLYRQAGEGLAAQLTQEWGSPDFADGSVQAWDLDRVRRGRR